MRQLGGSWVRTMEQLVGVQQVVKLARKPALWHTQGIERSTCKTAGSGADRCVHTTQWRTRGARLAAAARPQQPPRVGVFPIFYP